ncbi:4'-phosphopantetheinyl transferase superfamily protein [Streptomyces sp. NPDC047082]|uniref:4'-phosphopantetheinyl transferase family protein n=1 Tax=Streptomyces sp. NPDC047082 TaxID=3155259 RepID=UPI0033C09EBD
MAAPADRFPLLGVDLELAGLPLKAGHLVLSAQEERLLGRGAEARRLLCAMYSAKEAAFKALGPLLGDGLPGLRPLRPEAHADGYLVTSLPGAPLGRVSVRRLTHGVLSWAVAADGDL